MRKSDEQADTGQGLISERLFRPVWRPKWPLYSRAAMVAVNSANQGRDGRQSGDADWRKARPLQRRSICARTRWPSVACSIRQWREIWRHVTTSKMAAPIECQEQINKHSLSGYLRQMEEVINFLCIWIICGRDVD